MKINSLYSIIAIAGILSLPFCKSNKNDPGPIPPPDNGGDTMTTPPDNGGDTMTTPPSTPAGITYAEPDNSPLPGMITLTEESSNIYEYTIVLNSQPAANVEVEITLPFNAPSNLSIASGSQNASGADASITLTFATDTWDTSQMVTLTLTDDDILSSINGNLIHIVTSSDNDYNNKATLNRVIELQLIDSEVAVLYQKDGENLPELIELTEGTDSEYSYMIVLAKQPTAPVEIEINLDNAPDNLRINEGGTPVTFTSITFTNSPGGANGWDIPQTINLTFTDNDIISGPIMSALTHITSSTDTDYNSLPNKNLIIRLIDDESPCIQAGAGTETGFNPPTIPGENYGTGAMDDPYIICNSNQLQAMKDDLDAHYELGQDIDASMVATNACPIGTMGTCTGFQPIGNCGVDGMCDNADDAPFTVSLDGKGFTINDLTINMNLTSGASNAGLFGYTLGANIRNIGLLNVNISSSSSGASSFAGGLVGNNNRGSSISNSYSTGNISSSSSFSSAAGGLVGLHNADSITNCYSTGNISSSGTFSFAGGLVGSNSATITNCYSTGNVSSYASGSGSFLSNAGGLVGLHNADSITNSYSTGNVSSSDANAGGLVGVHNAGSITNSYYDQDTSILFQAGAEVTQMNEMAVGSNTGTLTCVGGFASSSFTTNTSIDTGTCDDASPTIFFNWQTPFDVDNADMDDNPTTGTDESSVRYDSNNDGSVNNMDDFVWNFGSNTEYPFIASTPGTRDQQAVTMASGFLRFSSTILGEPSVTDFVFFYDIDDAAMDITTSGTGVQGTAAGSYVIEDANGNALTAPTVTNAGVINGVGSLSAGAEFYLKVTFTRVAASYTTRYRFKK